MAIWAVLLYVGLMKPLSRGQLHLSSSDPAAAPVIDLGYFADPGDIPRLIRGVRVAEQLARTPPLSRFALGQVFPGPQASRDDAELEAAIRANIATYFHPVGTCRMGPSADATAVVDAKGSVHGTRGLSVVDASIMPTIPAANTNLPTFMLAERCAAWLTEGR